jgi:hypothetical protein
MKFVILRKAWNEIGCSIGMEWGGMVSLATFVVSGRRGSRLLVVQLLGEEDHQGQFRRSWCDLLMCEECVFL